MSNPKKFITTIVIESSYDPAQEEMGPISLVMDASTGSSSRIVKVETVVEVDSSNVEQNSTNKKEL